MNEDRNIRVGQIAARINLINPDQLALATSAWASDKSTPMADVLQRCGFLDATGRRELDRLVREELGDDPGLDEPGMSTLSAIDVRSGSAPMVPPAGPPGGPDATVALSFPAMETAFFDGPPGTDSPTRCFEPSAADHIRLSSLDDLGSSETNRRYARTHIHAKGGIGQVWVARDGDLGREVALKELRPEQVRNPVAWARFVEEARITGQLEHPGIVPVYELGVGADDRNPFYTMRFIRGKTLKEAVRHYHKQKGDGPGDPLGLATLLNAFVALCNTVAYAHSRGVIHRDLKGQNVVLGDFGEVILLDWGIAKLVDQDGPASEPQAEGRSTELPVSVGDDASAHEPTIQGQVLGTPFYMAPEQAEGRIGAIDRRTDVYGLGAILYEILCGRPPYGGESTVEVLRKVVEEAPESPRKLTPGTPPALDAICLKAMAKKPGDRYESAIALAEEVRRWLADEPVTAYRDPWSTRLARWSKRHRSAVASAAALIFFVVVALSVSTVLIRRERDEARRQRQMARRAVDDNYTQVAEQWLEDRLDPLQREFLEKALAYYRDFAGPEGDEPAARQEQGRAFLRMGDVLRKLGRHDEAEEAYRRSIEIMGRLAAADPASAEPRDRLAEATFRLGSERAARGGAGGPDEADRLYLRAAGLQEALLESAPTTARRVALGRTVANRGELFRVRGRADEAEAAFGRAIVLLDRAQLDDPKELAPRQELASASEGLGRLLAERGRAAEAAAAYLRSVGLFEALVAQSPHLPAARDGLARTYNGLGLLARLDGQGKDPETLIRKEIALNQRLADDYPARPEYRRTLARGLLNLGILCQESNRTREAEALYRQALEVNQKLAEEDPGVWKFRRDEARCLNNLGQLLMSSGKGESEGLFKKAIERYDALIKGDPEVPDHRISAAGTRLNLGIWLSGRNRTREATEATREAVSLVEAVAANDTNVEARRVFARSLNALGNALHREGKHREADDAYRRAVNAYDQLVSRPEATPRDRLDLANSWGARGNNQMVAKFPEAEESLRRSVALMQPLADGPAPPADLRVKFAAARSNLGDWLLAAGKLDEAESCFQKAVDAFDALVAEAPTNLEYQLYLGSALGSFGELRIAQRRPADARPLLEKSLKAGRTVLAANPRQPQARELLQLSTRHLASACLEAGDYLAAAKAGEESLKGANDPPTARAQIARLLARCGPLALADPRQTEVRRALMAGDFADRAIALLREAVENGDAEAEKLLAESVFDPIRQRDGFRLLASMVPRKVGRSVVEGGDPTVR